MKYKKYLFNFLLGIKYNKYFLWTTVLRERPTIKAPKQRKKRETSWIPNKNKEFPRVDKTLLNIIKIL